MSPLFFFFTSNCSPLLLTPDPTIYHLGLGDLWSPLLSARSSTHHIPRSHHHIHHLFTTPTQHWFNTFLHNRRHSCHIRNLHPSGLLQNTRSIIHFRLDNPPRTQTHHIPFLRLRPSSGIHRLSPPRLRSRFLTSHTRELDEGVWSSTCPEFRVRRLRSMVAVDSFCWNQ